MTDSEAYRKFIQPNFSENDRLSLERFIEYFKAPGHHYLAHDDGFVSWCDLGRGIVGIHFLVIQFGRRGWGNGRRFFGQWKVRMKNPKAMLESEPETVGFWEKMGFHEVQDYEYVIPAEISPTGIENRNLVLMTNFDQSQEERDWMVKRWLEEGYGKERLEEP